MDHLQTTPGRIAALTVFSGTIALAWLAYTDQAPSVGTSRAGAAGRPVEVRVSEGTSMAVGVSPDGRTLAIDLQGSIWTLPAAGGEATRITDVFNDARQPTWSPDGRAIAFFAYREGTWDIWAVAPDGSGLRKLTSGPDDDREPAWSHDGTRIAFSSDRGDGASNAIWVLDLASGQTRRVTRRAGNGLMPVWSPDDSQIAFVSQDANSQSIWTVSVASGVERQVSSQSKARLDAPSWGPDGRLIYHALEGPSSRLEVNGTPLTVNENVFPFRVSWASPTEFFYTSDGKIRRRTLGGDVRTVEFTATLEVSPARYTRRARDFGSPSPRRVLGIVRPAISPDGTKVAFAALGDIYVMPIGSRPENLTRDRHLDVDPAWSPDGTQLVYASDRGGNLLQLWIRDLSTGRARQLTDLPTQPMAPTWSPDGTRIAFLNTDGPWRWAQVSLVEVATGRVTKIHDSLFGPGTPTWSPDGRRVAVATLTPYSPRFREGATTIGPYDVIFREGTNQILTIPTEGGDVELFSPVPHLSIDSRQGGGPAWSPDGTKMALIYEGLLWVVPVSRTGQPLGPPRRLTADMAHAPSWTADSKWILYQSMDKLKIVGVETGEVRDVPLSLSYTYDAPAARLVVHAGRLVDGNRPTALADVDIVIEGNRIRSVEPHANARHSNAVVVDASNLTVMPGLIEWHSHLQNDFGEAQGRAWLAFGVTTVRSPGGTPYEAAENREAIDAGVRPGPRIYAAGFLMEWHRVRYKMGVAISSPAHLELEMQRTKALDLDLMKSYVRMPLLQQRRMVEFAHGIGIPVATHELYPAAFVGMDATEHTSGSSARGYSSKIATLERSYADVIEIMRAADMVFAPMGSGPGLRRISEIDPDAWKDPRFRLYPKWMRPEVTNGQTRSPAPSPRVPAGTSQMIMDAHRAGVRIVVGTDSPNAFNTHGALMTYVLAGLTPFEALRAATVTPADALGLEAGSVEAGKLADLVVVDGNPLEDISHTRKVKTVIANGRVYTLEDLLRGSPSAPLGTESAR